MKRLGSRTSFGFGGGGQTLHLVNLEEQERDGDRERDFGLNAEIVGVGSQCMDGYRETN